MKKLQTARIEALQLEQSDYRDVRTLAAGVNEDHTVPAGAAYCALLADNDLWVKPGGTAAVPTDITDGTGPIYVVARVPKIIRMLDGVAVIATLGLISVAGGKVSLEFFK